MAEKSSDQMALLWGNPRSRMLIIFFGALLSAWISMLAWMDRVEHIEKDVDHFWQILHSNCVKRLDVLRKFGQIINYSAKDAESLLGPLAETYNLAYKYQSVTATILVSPQNIAIYSDVQARVVDALSLLQRNGAIYPALNQNPDFQALWHQLEDLELQINFAIHAINQKITLYNSKITGFPASWTNAVYSHFPLKYSINVATFFDFNKGKSR